MYIHHCAKLLRKIDFKTNKIVIPAVKSSESN